MSKIYCVMEYVCPKTWESLAVTARDDIRYCDHCSKKVYLCASQVEVDSASLLGKCVAFDSVQLAADLDSPQINGKAIVVAQRTLGLPSTK